jgi:DnaJ-class molecular chaperone
MRASAVAGALLAAALLIACAPAAGASAVQKNKKDVDFYEVLGVSRDATDKEIKKAFRKLSVQNHPDKGGNKEVFQQIQRAYEVLSDEELRLVYDHAGLEGLDQHEKSANAPASPFDAFFGGGHQRNMNRGPEAKVDMQVSLEDMYNGNEVSMSIKRRVVCRNCKGRSNWKKEHCASCGECPPEVKMVQQQVAPGFVVQQQQQVPSEHRCKQEPKELKMTVEKGAPDGHEVRFKGASEQSPGQVPGDVVVSLKQKSHHTFTRKGDHLHMTMDISLKEALTGFSRIVKQMDGRDIVVEETGVTGPYSTKTIKGEGMPKHGVPSETGDLKIQMKVKFPKSLTPDQVEQINKIFAA